MASRKKPRARSRKSTAHSQAPSGLAPRPGRRVTNLRIERVSLVGEAGERVVLRKIRRHGRGRRPGVPTKLSIPNHPTLDRGLLRAFIRDAGLTVDQFNSHLRRR